MAGSAADDAAATAAAPLVPPALLFSQTTVVGLSAAWACFWLVVHAACRPGKSGDPAVGSARCSQLYAGLAVLGGLWLLLRCRSWPEDLFRDFSVEHQALFAMAAGHCAAAAWEDARGLDRKAYAGVRGLARRLLLQAQGLPRGLAAGGFLCLLLLQSCAAVGTFGLVAELPSLLLSSRRLALGGGGAPPWLREKAGVKSFWSWAHGLFALARGGPVAVYAYSLLFWQSELDALQPLESLVYHASALTFAALNYIFSSVMDAGYRHDIAALRHGEAGEASPPSGDVEQGVPTNPGAAPLRSVPQELLASKTSMGDDGSIWVEVDGSAYDVTSYLGEHPGGEQVLRSWAGRDASEAFRSAGHSREARATMARFLVGPVVSPPSKYRIFEHGEVESAVAAVLSALAAACALEAVAMSCLALGRSAGSAADLGLLDAVLIGLLVALATGILAVVVSCLLPSEAAARPAAGHALALCLLAYHVGLFGACQRHASAARASWAPAAEMAACAVLLAERCLSSTAFAGSLRAMSTLFGLVLLLQSWRLRASSAAAAAPDASQMLQAVESDLARPLLAALALGIAVPFLARQLGAGGASGRLDGLVGSVVRPLRLSGVYGLLGLVLLSVCSTEAGDRLRALLVNPAACIASLLVAAAASVAGLAGLANAASKCCPAFAARAAAFLLAALGLLSQGLGSYRWLSAMAFLWYLAELAARNRLRLHAAANAGRFQELPPHVVGAQAVWDRARTWLATALWRNTVVRLANLLRHNFFMPPELAFFATEEPVYNLGRRATYGVAAHFAPKLKRGQAPPVPQYFVCNVGQIVEHALGDIQKTMNNLLDVWKEFEEPSMKGLVANMVAVFPSVSWTNQCSITKEINLSGWESGKDAYAWYAKSPGHKTALTQHSSGILRTFGNLLASLQPSQDLLHRDRCQRCARPIDATEPGGRAARTCASCGGPSFQYPLF